MIGRPISYSKLIHDSAVHANILILSFLRQHCNFNPTQLLFFHRQQRISRDYFQRCRGREPCAIWNFAFKHQLITGGQCNSQLTELYDNSHRIVNPFPCLDLPQILNLKPGFIRYVQ
ncbi:hypothetical protein D3C86_1706640 [compost metagenome]